MIGKGGRFTTKLFASMIIIVVFVLANVNWLTKSIAGIAAGQVNSEAASLLVPPSPPSKNETTSGVFDDATSSSTRSSQTQKKNCTRTLVSPDFADLSVAALDGKHLPLTTTTVRNSSASAAAAPDGESPHFHGCPMTTQVKLYCAEDEEWWIESLHMGIPKATSTTNGGDEFYVTYTDNSMTRGGPSPSINNLMTAAAIIVPPTHNEINHHRYGLKFYFSPINPVPKNVSGRGTVTIHVHYSCGMGTIHQPGRDHWTRSGAINAKFDFYNVSMPMIENLRVPNIDKKINLGKYARVFYFGDSTMLMFAGSLSKYRNPKYIFKQNGRAERNVMSSLNTDTVERYKAAIRNQTWATLQVEGSDNTALVLGSHAWDIVRWVGDGRYSFDLAKHLDGIEQVVAFCRQEFPQTDLYWRSPMASHIHTGLEKRKWRAFKLFVYVDDRASILYDAQKALLQRLNVTFLDIFRASQLSADWQFRADPIHYKRLWNRIALGWFYVTGRNRRGIALKDVLKEK